MAERIIDDLYGNLPYDLLACIEFLANDAFRKERHDIHDILMHASGQIKALHTSEENGFVDFDYSDILSAFRLFTKFCIMGDDSAKQAVIDCIGAMDSSVFSNYDS